MHIRRGLFRLWIVFSVIFAIATIASSIDTLNTAYSRQTLTMDNDAAEKADFNLVFGEDVNPKLNDALRQANDVFQKFINQRNPGAIIKIATLYVRMPNGSTYAVNTPDGNEKKADKMDIASPSPTVP